MKRTFTFLMILWVALGATAQNMIDVVVGAGYVNDVYYSFDNGAVTTQTNSDWDIAFATDNFDVSILANHKAGVEVYAYPGDISAWSTVDISNIASWSQLFNSVYNWEEGAFSFNTDPNDAMDFGWGVYNIMSHHIVGDSLFVVKTRAGTYKKVWIVEKNPLFGDNTWEFKYANIDGTSEQTKLIEGDNYITKNFVYYSLDDDQIIDREPASNSWELLFGKYHDYTIPYTVTGVLANTRRVTVQQVDGVDVEMFEAYEEADFNDTVNQIGSDWKDFNMTTFAYDIIEDRVYFAKVMDNDGADSTYWKLYFTDFTGSTDGKYTFVQERLSTTLNIDEPAQDSFIEVFPNPANESLNLLVDAYGELKISIYDLSGKQVMTKRENGIGLSKFTLDINNLTTGIYSIMIETPERIYQSKFSKQ